MPHQVLATLASAQIETLRNGLRIMALRALNDADLAEDVAQESLLRALNSVTPDVAADPVRMGAFVGGIARHVIADVRRGAARFGALALEPPTSSEDDALNAIMRAEEWQAVQRALEKLSVDDRSVLHKSFVIGMTPAEVAAASGEPAERVRKRKSRALSRLREVLASIGHDGAAAPSKLQEMRVQPGMEGGR